MSCADSEGRDTQSIGPQTGACGAHSSDQEPTGTLEETATVPPVDTLASNFSREASKPKSEEPTSNFSDIPHEAVSPVVPRTFVLTKKLFKTPSERALEAAENERRLREAGEIFRQGLFIRPSTPITTQPTLAKPDDSNNDDDVQIVEKDQQTSPVELDIEIEGASATARFKSLKRSYQRKKKNNQNTIEDDIAFSKARNAEELRLKLESRKRAYDDVDSDIEIVEDDSLFFAEETPLALDGTRKEGEDGISEGAPKKRKPCRPNKIPESALQDALQIGCDALIAEERKNASKKGGSTGTAKKKEPKEPKTRVSKAKDRKVDGLPKPKRGRPHKGPKMLNIGSLFHNDIVSAAQANVGKALQPGFSSTNKKDALAELIASIPEEERTTHNADKNALDKATKSFTGHAAMKADGNNGWRLRGMQTSLYHYQLLGAAFMRERENSSTRPYGGLQSDEMGLGKTVTCLANIVDGQAPRNSPNRTTLIVCPGALCSQWLNEIKKHVLPTTFQDVIVYRAGGRIESSNPTKTMSNMDIIITSYNEVLRSYPHCETPMHLVTPEAKTEWWSEYFKANRGVLHQIFFRRIVLDEAQAIKNHSSKISVAVRSLSGKYRWAISGTPVQNKLEEFFPFFSFLKVPNTGSLDTFKNNYTGRNKITDLRLQTLLRQIMIRRTHLDTIFGRPLLQLPGITTNTVKVDFSECEKAVYKIVKNRFIAKIYTYARSGDLDKKYRYIFVLYLRLRQLVGHILLVQRTLKDLLESEDLEKLWRLTETEVHLQRETGNQGVLSQLRELLPQARDAQTAARNQAAEDNPTGTLADKTGMNDVDDCLDGTFGLAFKFRKYLRSLKDSGKWEEINNKSLCHKCGGVPDNPHLTSCLHVYCKECLEAMLFNAAHNGGDKAKCLACDAVFEQCEPCRGFDQAGERRTPDRRTRKSAESEETDIDYLSVGGSILPSAKTLAVKAQIQNWVDEDPKAKIIIFTQFRDMIRILSRMMEEEKWGWSQFHGGMSFAARDKAILDFAEKEETKVLLASLKAGGIGLNLTMASKVIIIDLWWNESAEQQALCRCFRIGQDRPVDICRIVVKDSIDDEILAMQERKTRDIDMAMVAKNRPGRMTTQELLRLFGPIDWNAEDGDDHVASPFIFVEDEDDDDDQSDSGPPTRVPAPHFE